MHRRDILRLWAQIVQHTGVEEYTAEEWQEHYENFWKHMQSNEMPYIRLESIDLMLKDDISIKPDQIQRTKRNNEARIVNNELVPHVLRKRLKLATDNRLLIQKSNESKVVPRMKCTRKRNTNDKVEDHIPNSNTIIIDEPMTSSKLLDSKTRNRVSISNRPKDKAIDIAESSIKKLTKNCTPTVQSDSSDNWNLRKEQLSDEEQETLNKQREHLQLEQEISHLEAELDQLYEAKTQPKNQMMRNKNSNQEKNNYKKPVNELEDEQKNQEFIGITKLKVQDKLTDEMEPDNKKQVGQESEQHKLQPSEEAGESISFSKSVKEKEKQKQPEPEPEHIITNTKVRNSRHKRII
ncbi:A-kinase anchor protein 9-like [Drosophila navojoa]|uniref:A-kinase anchor protein 9-like n=1 Tax=Drosophila navojoa TaxID=7232 RepID=UPI0011BDA61E|nr:A-kinase anchor protein 9-like [Drosophila navojoa]